MNVKDRMTTTVVTVKPHDSVRHARELLERHRINQLPVVVDGRLVGIVTDRDLRDAFPSVFEHRRRRSGDAATDPDAIPVEDVMTRDVLTIAPDVPVGDGARLMRRQRIGAIPVVEGRRLVGILTRSDVLDAFLATSASQGARGVSPVPPGA
jgi:acetoin utilization protein AcuB